jgi:hypothetical protein
MGSTAWEWVRTPDDSRKVTRSPRSKAQEAISEDVSIARMVAMAGILPCGHVQ